MPRIVGRIVGAANTEKGNELDRSRLAVIIPCHNEAATLGDVVSGAMRYGDVLVVDDRSSDGSARIAINVGAVVIESAQRGYDGALDTGLRQAFATGYDYLITLDADGEHDPDAIAGFIRAFDAGFPLVCGFRPRPQRPAEYVVAGFGMAFYGVRDLLCGMKGYSRTVFSNYVETESRLLLNMAPTVLWRKAHGRFAQTFVNGRRRTGRTRFGEGAAANVAILIALYNVAKLTAVR